MKTMKIIFPALLLAAGCSLASADPTSGSEGHGNEGGLNAPPPSGHAVADDPPAAPAIPANPCAPDGVPRHHHHEGHHQSMLKPNDDSNARHENDCHRCGHHHHPAFVPAHGHHEARWRCERDPKPNDGDDDRHEDHHHNGDHREGQQGSAPMTTPAEEKPAGDHR